MATELEIMNKALSHLGAEEIEATYPTEQSREARECDRHYADCRDVTLRAHEWGFANKRDTLALSTETVSGWDYVYVIPSDCLIPRRLYNAYGSTTGTYYNQLTDTYEPKGDIEYELVTDEDGTLKLLATNEESAILIYTKKITNPTIFDVSFRAALEFRLAADLAVPLRGDSDLAERLLRRFYMQIAEAESLDANADHRKPNYSSILSEARN